MTRVEGEGQVVLKVLNGLVTGVEVRITEAPRLFECIVKGRRYFEIPDLTSRICGLCGVSHAYTASKAFENCLSIDVPEDEEKLRLAILAAERIKSHLIHITLLHLPDFIGLGSLKELVESYSHIYSKTVKTLLWARKTLEVLGGRIHNVLNIRVGGVFSFPSASRVENLKRELLEVLKDFLDVAEFILDLNGIPTEDHRLRYMAVKGDGHHYPWTGDNVLIDNGYSVSVENFENFLTTERVEYSNALRYRLASGEPYLVGPLARYNTNYRFLREEVRELIDGYGYGGPLINVYESIVARVAETYQTLLDLREFLDGYKERRTVIVEPKRAPRGKCVAITEAPRGVLYHRYDLDGEHRVRGGNIVTPTAQNLASMENVIASRLLGVKADVESISIAKKIIRSYDPCISCSVHILHTPRGQ